MAQQGLGALGGHVAAAGGLGSFLNIKLEAQVIPRPVDDNKSPESLWAAQHIKKHRDHLEETSGKRGNATGPKKELIMPLFGISKELGDEAATSARVVHVLHAVDLLDAAQVAEASAARSHAGWMKKQEKIVTAVGGMVENFYRGKAYEACEKKYKEDSEVNAKQA